MKHLVIAFLLVVASDFVEAATYDDLLQRIPDSANSLIMLDVEAMFGSDIAKTEKWKEAYADEYAATPLIVPPDAKRFVLGAELDLETMKPSWEAASMEMSVDVSAETISQKIGGVVDSISGSTVVWIRKGFCVASFSRRMVGLLSPTNRQNAGRWIKDSGKSIENHSSYLKDAAQYAANGGPTIVMALDLKDLIRAEEIRAAVEDSGLFKPNEIDDATALLAGIRGMTFGVGVADQINGRLMLDFDADAQVLAEVVKPLILRILANVGAMVDDFNQWDSAVEGKRAAISGTLSPENMRRLFSMVALDSAMIQREPESTVAEPQGETARGFPTLRYFQTVLKYLEDIQRPSQGRRDFSKIALFISNYATRIEKIPTRGVDPDMLAYANQVAYHLRDAVANLHGTAQRASERTSQVRNNSTVSFGAVPTFRRVNFGGIRMREYAPMSLANVDIGAAEQKRGIASAAYKEGQATAAQVMEQIKAETAAIRQEMKSRYRLSF